MVYGCLSTSIATPYNLEKEHALYFPLFKLRSVRAFFLMTTCQAIKSVKLNVYIYSPHADERVLE